MPTKQRGSPPMASTTHSPSKFSGRALGGRGRGPGRGHEGAESSDRDETAFSGEMCSWAAAVHETIYVHNDREDLIDFADYVYKVVQRCALADLAAAERLSVANSGGDEAAVKHVRQQWTAGCELVFHDFAPAPSLDEDEADDAEGEGNDVGDSVSGASWSYVDTPRAAVRCVCQNIGIVVPDPRAPLHNRELSDPSASISSASMFVDDKQRSHRRQLGGASTSRQPSPKWGTFSTGLHGKQTIVWHVPVAPIALLTGEVEGVTHFPNEGTNVCGPESVSGASSSYSISTREDVDPQNGTPRIISSSARTVYGRATVSSQVRATSGRQRSRSGNNANNHRSTGSLDDNRSTPLPATPGLQLVSKRDLARSIDARERAFSHVLKSLSPGETFSRLPGVSKHLLHRHQFACHVEAARAVLRQKGHSGVLDRCFPWTDYDGSLLQFAQSVPKGVRHTSGPMASHWDRLREPNAQSDADEDAVHGKEAEIDQEAVMSKESLGTSNDRGESGGDSDIGLAGDEVAVEDLEADTDQGEYDEGGHSSSSSQHSVPNCADKKNEKKQAPKRRRIMLRGVHSQAFGATAVADAVALDAQAGPPVGSSFTAFDFAGPSAGVAARMMRQVRVRAAQYPSSAFLGGAPMGAPPRSIGGQRGTSIHLQTWALITSVHPSMRAFCFADGVVSWRKWGQTTCTVPFLSFADALDIAHGQDEAGNGGSAPPSPRSVDSETRDGSSDPTGPGAQLRRRVFHAARQALQLVQHQLQSAYIAARGHADCGQRAFELLELHFVLQANGFPCLVDVCSPCMDRSDPLARGVFGQVLEGALRISSISTAKLWQRVVTTRHDSELEHSIGEETSPSSKAEMTFSSLGRKGLQLSSEALQAIAEQERKWLTAALKSSIDNDGRGPLDNGQQSDASSFESSAASGQTKQAALCFEDWVALMGRLRAAEDVACRSRRMANDSSHGASAFVRLFPLEDCSCGWDPHAITLSDRRDLSTLVSCWMDGRPTGLSELFQAGAYGTPSKVSLAGRKHQSGDSTSTFARRKEAREQQERNKKLLAEKARAKYSNVKSRVFDALQQKSPAEQQRTRSNSDQTELSPPPAASVTTRSTATGKGGNVPALSKVSIGVFAMDGGKPQLSFGSQLQRIRSLQEAAELDSGLFDPADLDGGSQSLANHYQETHEAQDKRRSTPKALAVADQMPAHLGVVDDAGSIARQSGALVDESAKTHVRVISATKRTPSTNILVARRNRTDDSEHASDARRKLSVRSYIPAFEGEGER
eukprot:INCI1071.3.p1 GENE.INCI1071.3~~INCI1071.3.p1  ORF type:complete len:1273 (-),score=174.57 INCI1071.3:425-4243(-)